MALPDVDIEILNNQLGSVDPVEDRVPGLIVSGIAATGLAISTPKQIFTLKEAEALGIDEAYDTTNTTDVYKQIKEFYDRAGNGKELNFMIVPKTSTLESICDKANDIAVKLLDFANGRITHLGVTRVPDVAFVPTYVDGIDDDVYSAVLKAHALAQEYASVHTPFRVLIGARDFQGDPAILRDFRLGTENRVGVVLGQTKAGDKGAAVGFTLGQFMNRDIQRNIGRVKDGNVGLDAAYMSDGLSTETYKSAWGAIHDKGYIFFRTFPNKTGYYFNDDPACCPKSDDYGRLARGFVVDKGHRIAYATAVEEILDDLEIDEAGYMSGAVVKSYQQKLENAISLQMIPVNASAVRCEIDPAQNLLATDKVQIKKLGIRPKGYAGMINIPLGFTNPLNQ